MTILILTHSYPDFNNSWRGIFIKEQVRALSLNHKIVLLYFKVDNSSFSPFSEYKFLKNSSGNITEFELTTARSFPVINQLKYLRDTYRFIKKEIIPNYHIELIHSHLSYPAGFLGTIIWKINNLPCVVTEHSKIYNYFRSPVHKLCVRYTLKNAPVVICVSQGLRKEMLEFVKREIIVVHNVIDVDQFKLINRNNVKDQIDIGFLGSLKNDNKGLDILLKAAANLKDMSFKLHIGGQGALQEEYKSMAVEMGINDNCIFYGEVQPDERLNFFSKLDIFVLPSRSETFGMVLVEAMACGIPVISTKCGGPSEIVTNETGILVEINDREGLEKAIYMMCTDHERFNRNYVRNYVINNFSSESLVNNLTPIYKTLLAENKPV